MGASCNLSSRSSQCSLSSTIRTTSPSKTVSLATECSEFLITPKVPQLTDITRMRQEMALSTSELTAASQAIGTGMATQTSNRITSCKTITANTLPIASRARMHTRCKTLADHPWSPALNTSKEIRLNRGTVAKIPAITRTMQCQCTATTHSSSASQTTT